MRALASILLIISLAACAACRTTAPDPEPPLPPIVEPSTGHYFITEYDTPGHVHRMWTVSTFTERDFPRSVTFKTADGQIITLTGSYQIDHEAK